MEEIQKQIKSWCLRNNINYSSEINYKWWRVGTSIVSILKKLQQIEQSYFMCEAYEGDDLNSARFKIFGLDGLYSKTTIQQYFRIGLIFGVMYCDEFICDDNATSFLQKWIDDKIALKFDLEFFKYPSINNYLVYNVEKIINIWRKYLNSKVESFLTNDINKIIFNFAIFENIILGKINNEDLALIISKNKQKADSNTKQYFDEYKYNSELKTFISKIMEG